MKIPRILALSLVLTVLAGCSTVESRIEQHRMSFASWAPEVQQAVSEGRIGVGFTAEQVRVALGDPDAVFHRTAQTGSFEVWSYADKGPRFSFGVGVGGGSFHRGGGYSTGLGISTGAPAYPEERLRVVFDQNFRVASIEEIRRGR